jgi:ATP-binding cassette, subfamily A (ABC1), member 5
VPNQRNPSFDPYAEVADLESYRFYTSQGFSLMQNWCANTVLQVQTEQFDAAIVSMVAPMITNSVTIDKFSTVSEQVMPMFLVLMYLMPIYRFTSRLVGEKQKKTRDLTRLVGVSETAYWLSWLVLYTAVVTIVSVGCTAILIYTVFKYTAFLPLFICLWLYGFSLFGYILLIQSFFRTSVTLASVVSTLIFFITSFLDLLVASSSMPQEFVMLASILPTVSIRRAITTISSLEQQKRGFTFDTSDVQI